MNSTSGKYAVIFISTLKPQSEGYSDMSAKMEAMLLNEPGYLGMDSTRNENSGIGITISYWKDLESIKNWKKNEEHQLAQEKGKTEWYSKYEVKICKVEREYTS